MKIIITILCLMFTMLAWASDIPDADSASARVFSQRCSACHSLPHPARLDWEHWRSILHLMKQRMDEDEMSIPTADWKHISSYLKQHAR